MSKSNCFIGFIFGIAIGSLATWQYVKKKYEQIAQDEINSVKEVFNKKKNNENEVPKDIEVTSQAKAEKAKEKPDIIKYAEVLSKNGYTEYSNIEKNKKKEETKVSNNGNSSPYIISPEEFGDNDEYDKISLTYYADKILADDNDELVEDIEKVVGSDSLNHFGEFEDDAVYVRNDNLKCDYEILIDHRNYSDVVDIPEIESSDEAEQMED